MQAANSSCPTSSRRSTLISMPQPVVRSSRSIRNTSNLRYLPTSKSLRTGKSSRGAQLAAKLASSMLIIRSSQWTLRCKVAPSHITFKPCQSWVQMSLQPTSPSLSRPLWTRKVWSICKMIYQVPVIWRPTQVRKCSPRGQSLSRTTLRKRAWEAKGNKLLMIRLGKSICPIRSNWCHSPTWVQIKMRALVNPTIIAICQIKSNCSRRGSSSALNANQGKIRI